MSRSRGGRPWFARFLGVSVTTLAAVVVALAVPGAVRFAIEAPGGFWAMALGALLVDIPLFGVIRRGNPRLRPTLSVCFTFAIFVLWGAAPAIVVQAVAGAVTVLGQRYHPRSGLYLIARLVLATAVAEFFTVLVDPRPITRPGGELDGGDLLTFLLLATVWCAASYGLLVAAAKTTVTEYVLRHATVPILTDLFGTVAAVLVGSPLLTAVTDWWPLAIAAPLAAWNGLSRVHLRHEDRLSREPVSGTLNWQGLAGGVAAMTTLGEAARGPRPFGIILIRSEAMVTINRTLGRELYEAIAAVAARRLSDVYGNDRVARLAGEGLVVLVPDLPESGALPEAENAVANVAQRIEVNHIPVTLDPVGGVALSPQHGRDLTTLLAKAELAMIEARRQNHAAVLYVQEVADLARRRIELLREIRQALSDPDRRDEVTVHYQPQVDLATNRLVGLEALVRWTHPQWGAVPPDELIEAIESTDVIHLLTWHVLSTVAVQLQRWNGQGERLRVAVNVSVRDLFEPDFAGNLLRLVQTHGVEPAQLTIEITERMFIENAPLAQQTCETLRRLGFGLSMDDFGTGHASLRQLRQLPLTEIKIDGSYVRGVADNPADLAIVIAVQDLARVSKVRVVAEGIEDRRTVDVLAGIEGAIGQGYYFGRPMPADALRPWLHDPVGAAGRRRP